MTTLRACLLLIAAASTTVHGQAPGFVYGTTAPLPVSATADRDAGLAPQFYSAPSSQPSSEQNARTSLTPDDVDPSFYSPDVQSQLYVSTGDGVPRPDAVAPPAFVQGHVPLAVSPTLALFHNQFEDGSYRFGYSGGPNTRTEVRDPTGTVRGAYNYVDANGEIQSQRYIADDEGFRTVGTDIPKPTFVLEDTPEVKAAKESLREAYEQAKARRSRRSIAAQQPVVAAPLLQYVAPVQQVQYSAPVQQVQYSAPVQQVLYSSSVVHKAAPGIMHPATYASFVPGFYSAPISGFSTGVQQSFPGMATSHTYRYNYQG